MTAYVGHGERLKHAGIFQGLSGGSHACRLGELCTAFMLGMGGTKLAALLLAEASCTAVITAATSTCNPTPLNLGVIKLYRSREDGVTAPHAVFYYQVMLSFYCLTQSPSV